MKTIRKLAFPILMVLIISALIAGSRINISGIKAPGGVLIEPFEEVLDGSEEHGTAQECVYHLPSNTNVTEWFLYFQSYWPDYEIFSDGVSIYAHTPDTPDGVSHIIALPTDNAPSEITIYYYGATGSTSFSIDNAQIFVGDAGGISRNLMHIGIFPLLLSFFTLVLAVASIGSALYFRNVLSGKYFYSLLWLGVFMVNVSIWIITDSKLLFLLTNHTTLVSLVSFLSFLCMPLSLLKFTKQIFDHEKKVLNGLLDICRCILALYILLYHFAPRYCMIAVYAEHVAILLTLVLIVFFGYQELRHSDNTSLLRVLNGYIVFGIFDVLALVVYYFGYFFAYSTLYGLGLVCFAFFLINGTCIGIYHLFTANQNALMYAKLAYQDLMTGMGNRTAFIEEQRGDSYRRGTLAYILTDINNLKTANDTLGHQKGDELIIAASGCLKNAVGPKHSCYRIGGDEMIARLKDVSQADLSMYLDRLQKEFARVSIEGIELSIAVGFSWTDSYPKDLDALFAEADKVMYENKQRIKENHGAGTTM